MSTKTTIAHKCPFCGGPVSLESEEIIAPCGNCGSMLRLLPPSGQESFLMCDIMKDREAFFVLERYLKGQKLPLIRKRGESFRINLPFYRAVGKIFDYQKRTIEHKKADSEGREYIYTTEDQNALLKHKEMSFSSFNAEIYGIGTLGVRTSILQLSPLTPKRASGKVFLRPQEDIHYALDRYDKSTAGLSSMAGEGSDRHFARSLCPKISTVYLPIFIINFANDSGYHYAVIDCVARRVVKLADGDLPLESLSYNDNLKGTVFTLVAHRCNYCGFDLPHQKNGEMFVCSNCGKLYKSMGESYKEQNINIPRGKHEKSRLFPFWMYRLSNTNDNIRLKQALRLDSDTIFIPAFEISNLKRAARLSISLSNAIDELDFDKLEDSDYNFNSACITAGDAALMVLPLLLAGRDNLEHQPLDELWKLYLEFDENRLIWLPFEEEGYFYRGQLTGQGFEKASLVT
jgi:predicted RNA-binding Zn-ribbon protein involved in translation (DUF1610 family)